MSLFVIGILIYFGIQEISSFQNANLPFSSIGNHRSNSFFESSSSYNFSSDHHVIINNVASTPINFPISFVKTGNTASNDVTIVSIDSVNKPPASLVRPDLAIIGVTPHCRYILRACLAEDNQVLTMEDRHGSLEGLQCELSRTDCYSRLRHLYLRRNSIKRLNFSLKRSFPSLVSLHLSNNEINDCGFIREVPSSLGFLYVDGNQITSIDSSVVQYLKTLDADDNKIEAICYKNCDSYSIKLLGTTRLEILSLARNRIGQIDSCAFQDSFALVCLNLAGNRIDSLHPSTLAPLRSLTQLNLDDNRLTCVPNLSGNWHLKVLALRNNRITQLKREQFSNAQTLQKLFLGDNGIRNVECGVFEDLTWLQMLDLSGNQIESLPIGWMRGLTNLKYLDLSNNRFVHVYQLSFTTSLCLKELHLENNKYTRTDESSVQWYFPNARIHLDSCSYNTSFKRISSDYTRDVYWEMSTKEKADFSYKLSYVTI